MRIILEGPDGAGKTTLAEAMSRRFGMPVMHLTYAKSDGLMERQFKATCGTDDIIIDRYVVSNIAYWSVFKSRKLSDQTLTSLMPDSLEKDLYVFCLPGYNSGGVDEYKVAYAKLVRERSEDFPDVEKMASVWKYMATASELMSPLGNVLVFDYNSDRDADSFIEYVGEAYGFIVS